MSIDFPPSDPRGRELILCLERAKFERWLANETGALIEREFANVVDLLLSRRYRELTIAQRQRAQQLYRALETHIRQLYGDVADLHLREMRGYAQLEAEIARTQAASLVAGDVSIRIGVSLPRAYLESIAKLPMQGLTLGEWWSAQAASMSLASRRAIQSGLVEGIGHAGIARRLLAPARVEGAVVSRRAVAEAKAISRTIVNSVQNDAAMKGYESLPTSVSDSYRLLVVRDARTTVICAALADKVFRFDDPKRKVPPFHIQCRTGVQPIIKGVDLGISEQKTGPMSFRSYGEWLTEQPIGVQNEILGVTRATYWRNGQMTLADAIDADNRVLTLAQLRERLGLVTAA